MLYVMFEAIETEEDAIFAQKSTILDGRRRRRENVEIKPPQPPVGVGDGLGLSSAKTKNASLHAFTLNKLDLTSTPKVDQKSKNGSKLHQNSIK